MIQLCGQFHDLGKMPSVLNKFKTVVPSTPGEVQEVSGQGAVLAFGHRGFWRRNRSTMSAEMLLFWVVVLGGRGRKAQDEALCRRDGPELLLSGNWGGGSDEGEEPQ